MSWEKDLQRWVDANLLDAPTAERIRQFENTNRSGLRWPAMLAIGFGALMLCAGVLLFVAAHWDEMSPAQRFTLALAMVAVFHLAGGLLGGKVPAMGVAMHLVGTITLGAGIYLAGQIFHLEEHWPGGLMLWSLGAVLGWIILRQWPQAMLAAVLIPCWLGGEWSLATESYRGAWNIAAQGFLLLAIVYLSATPREPNRALRKGMIWIGCFALIPMIGDVMFTGDVEHYSWGFRFPSLPTHLLAFGYASAYLPLLLLAAFLRRGRSVPVLLSAVWVFVLGVLSRIQHPEHSLLIYLWVALGACGLCYWGMRENRKLFINYGTVIFALDVITFYFSDVLDKLGRSMGLILLGAIFLAGGWVLNRLRSDLIVRAAAAQASATEEKRGTQ